jgi:hypothetical protein
MRMTDYVYSSPLHNDTFDENEKAASMITNNENIYRKRQKKTRYNTLHIKDTCDVSSHTHTCLSIRRTIKSALSKFHSL